jgi:SAM-dependent methyltransferase
MMNAGDQQRPGGPDPREETTVRHAASEYTPGLSGYDAELRRYNEVLLRACGIQPHDHVLDIGCGTGQTTRQAARTAQAGSAVGVDISAPAIERARELARAAAGFTGVTFTDVHEPVYYGPNITAALDWVRGFTCTKEMLKRLDPAAAERALRRLRDALAAHLSDDGVWFNSRAWIITARGY